MVRLLQTIADTGSLKYIYEAISLKLDYLSWDENYAFEVKCVRALYYIGGSNAQSYLEKLSRDDNEIIQNMAKRQLSKIIDQNDAVSYEIRAVYSDSTVRVYQAFNSRIAGEAVENGTFGRSFDLSRMTWIKPSFYG